MPQLDDIRAVDVRGAREGIVDDGTRRGTGADNRGHDVSAAVMGQAGLRELPAAQMQGPMPSHVYVRGVLQRSSRREIQALVGQANNSTGVPGY